MWLEGRRVQDLIARARDGDADAFTAAIGGSVDRLFGAAYLVLRDAGAAEDAVQDGLLLAWRRLPSLRDPDRFDAWVRRIVIHSAIDAVRRRRPTQVETEPVAAPGSASDVETRELVGAAFGRLAAGHRAVLVLRHYLDLTLPEIASTLGIPEGTAKSRLHHAHRRMREALVELDPGLEGEWA
jgi:RNA polymerase sigma-70 factor, ECF subfamily